MKWWLIGMVTHWKSSIDNVLKDYPEYSHLQGEDRLAASINFIRIEEDK